MANKYLRPRYKTLKINQLSKLASTLQSSLGSSDFYTSEQYLEEAIRVLTTFYKDLEAPIFDEAVRPFTGTIPNGDNYNKFLGDARDNLDLIFLEFENLEDLILANFNFVVTQNGRLTGRLKKIESLIGDYLLYSQVNQGIILVRDSFAQTDKLDLNSKLLNAPQCDVNVAEGIITLPIDISRERDVHVYSPPLIKSFPGVAWGNNFETGVKWNGNPQVILDGNPDSWFEYERVVRAQDDTGEPLVLDITLVLNEAKIINFIRVNPNNFGTRTTIKIDLIETSTDGKNFINIKDDVPIAGYLTEDEENVFILAPSTSKYAGQGLYTFTPRKAKYVHFIFRQTEAYAIETSAGQKLRYAIGLRDIELQAVPFFPNGEIVSKTFNFPQEITKVSLRASQNPMLESELASIKHYISGDNGVTWNEISPQESMGESGKVSVVPEIINFNNAAAGSVTTGTPVTELRWKAVLTRNDGAFTANSSALHQASEELSEIHDIPKSAPHAITLRETPITDTVNILDPFFGSRGLQNFSYELGRDGNSSVFYLPQEWKNLEPPMKKVLYDNPFYSTERSLDSEWLEVLVNDKSWTLKVSGVNPGDFSDYDIDDEVYSIDWTVPSVNFGTWKSGGRMPEGKVSLYFKKEEVPFIDGPGVPAKLAFTPNPESQFVQVEKYGPILNGSSMVSRGVSALKLQHQNIISILTTMPGTEVVFINGKDEFTGISQWSVNKTTGYVYLSEPNTSLRVIAYQYQPIEVLDNSDWDWGTVEDSIDGMVIKDSGWEVYPYSYELSPMPAVTSGLNYCLHLPHKNIVRGSLAIFPTVPSGVQNPFVDEVLFVDGRQEIDPIGQTTDTIPALTTGGAINYFNLQESIVSDTEYDVAFDETAINYFTNQIGDFGSVSSPGDYFVDRTEHRIYVFIDAAVASPGTITYYYNKPVSKAGLYSVDYATGRIFVRDPFNVLDALTVNYDYTDYRVSYPIGRRINKDDFTVNYLNKSVVFNSREVYRDSGISKTNTGKYKVTYRFVSLNRDDVNSLRDYFTPVLKDYVLKLLPRE